MAALLLRLDVDVVVEVVVEVDHCPSCAIVRSRPRGVVVATLTSVSAYPQRGILSVAVSRRPTSSMEGGAHGARWCVGEGGGAKQPAIG
jgi:hypothetical protein